jgi:hypothetical protein
VLLPKWENPTKEFYVNDAGASSTTVNARAHIAGKLTNVPAASATGAPLVDNPIHLKAW